MSDLGNGVWPFDGGSHRDGGRPLVRLRGGGGSGMTSGGQPTAVPVTPTASCSPRFSRPCRNSTQSPFSGRGSAACRISPLQALPELDPVPVAFGTAVVDSAIARQALPELDAVPVASVGNDRTVLQTPAACSVEQAQGDPPLLLEAYVVRHARLRATPKTQRPRLRQITPHADADATVLARKVQARGHLAVIDATHRP
jgi:hypothetical protein